MVLTHTIETDGRQAGANQHMVLTHTIETDGRRPYNRSRWPHNSRATAFCHAWPILLFVFHAVLYSLLMCIPKISDNLQAHAYLNEAHGNCGITAMFVALRREILAQYSRGVGSASE